MKTSIDPPQPPRNRPTADPPELAQPMRKRSQQLRLADEIRYIQRRAAAHDGRVVTIGPLVLFSTDTGDAWLLDPADHLAACLARNGQPEPIDLKETDATYVVGWPGLYHLDGPAFVYTDRQSRSISTIVGYPTHILAASQS